MTFEDLNHEYDLLQMKYGDKSLHSIYNGGCSNNPDICFVFMNPTGRNVASLANWHGIYAPWIGTKNIWDLFYAVGLLEEEIYFQIKSIKGSDWTPEFAANVYDQVSANKYFITNLGKCTQIDARPLHDSVYYEYLNLLYEEISLVNPKVIILFGNQVSSIVLGEKIKVSEVRKRLFVRNIKGKYYHFYSVFYPVGNGRFNIDKAIEDIKYIIDNEVGINE